MQFFKSPCHAFFHHSTLIGFGIFFDKAFQGIDNLFLQPTLQSILVGESRTGLLDQFIVQYYIIGTHAFV